MQIKERTWSDSSFSNRFGFNGQEKDDQISGIGNSYTAEFWQYDSRLGRRWNVDPVYSHSASNYQVFSNRPIIMIDPDGNSDYYSTKGKYLGSDGTNKTDIMIVTDWRVKRQLKKGNRKALRKGEYVNNGSLDSKSYFVLPPYEHRQQIKAIMTVHDPDGNVEFGGRGVRFTNGNFEHLRATDGKPAASGEVAEINLRSVHKDDRDKADNASDFALEYTWHAHTKRIVYYEKKPDSEEYVSLEAIMNLPGNSSTRGRRKSIIGGPTPSNDDLDNAQRFDRKLNFILLKDKKDSLNGTAIMYNNNRDVYPKLSLKFFLNTKAKSNENKK